MRRRALVIAISILLATQFQSANAAAIKAGVKCPKAGFSKVVNGYKFTCIKKGKVLVWNSGVKIAKPLPTPAASSAPTPTPISTPTAAGIDKALVSTHNTKTDCWSYLDGKVYNFTLWIKEHPGGEESVIYMCGGNGADLLRGHHGTEVDSYLAPYLIGNLS